jgi:hypothetical protein
MTLKTALPKVKELALRGFNLSILWTPLSALVIMASLSKLDLFECSGLPLFLAEYAENIGEVDPLQHFSLQHCHDTGHVAYTVLDETERAI